MFLQKNFLWSALHVPLVNQYGILTPIKISGVDWKSKNFCWFQVFLVRYRAKTKTCNWRKFERRSIREEKRREEKRRESRQTISFASFNYKILAKISERDFIKYRRWSILESGKLFCFPRKASKCIVSDLLIWWNALELIQHLKKSCGFRVFVLSSERFC